VPRRRAGTEERALASRSGALRVVARRQFEGARSGHSRSARTDAPGRQVRPVGLTSAAPSWEVGAAVSCTTPRPTSHLQPGGVGGGGLGWVGGWGELEREAPSLRTPAPSNATRRVRQATSSSVDDEVLAMPFRVTLHCGCFAMLSRTAWRSAAGRANARRRREGRKAPARRPARSTWRRAGRIGGVSGPRPMSPAPQSGRGGQGSAIGIKRCLGERVTGAAEQSAASWVPANIERHGNALPVPLVANLQYPGCRGAVQGTGQSPLTDRESPLAPSEWRP